MPTDQTRLRVEEHATVRRDTDLPETEKAIEITNSETGEKQAGSINVDLIEAVESGAVAVVLVKDAQGYDRGVPVSWITAGVNVPAGE